MSQVKSLITGKVWAALVQPMTVRTGLLRVNLIVRTMTVVIECE